MKGVGSTGLEPGPLARRGSVIGSRRIMARLSSESEKIELPRIFPIPSQLPCCRTCEAERSHLLLRGGNHGRRTGLAQ